MRTISPEFIEQCVNPECGSGMEMDAETAKAVIGNWGSKHFPRREDYREFHDDGVYTVDYKGVITFQGNYEYDHSRDPEHFSKEFARIMKRFSKREKFRDVEELFSFYEIAPPVFESDVERFRKAAKEVTPEHEKMIRRIRTEIAIGHLKYKAVLAQKWLDTHSLQSCKDMLREYRSRYPGARAEVLLYGKPGNPRYVEYMLNGVEGVYDYDRRAQLADIAAWEAAQKEAAPALPAAI